MQRLVRLWFPRPVSVFLGLLLGLLLTYLAYPNAQLHMGVLGLCSWMPLFICCLRCQRPWQVFALAWAFFQALFLSLLWMNPFQYPERLAYASTVIGLLVIYIVGPLLFSGLLYFVFKQSRRLPGTYQPFFVATCWVLFDWVLTLLPFSYPFHLAIAFYKLPILIQPAAWFGIYGVTFLQVLVNAGLANAWVSRQPKLLTGPLLLWFLALALSWVQLTFSPLQTAPNSPISPPSNAATRIAVTLVQPNLSWRDAFLANQHPFLYRRVVANLAAASPHIDTGVLVWPELSLVPLAFEEAPLQALHQQRLGPKASLITGAYYQQQNQVLLVSAKGQYLDAMPKQHQVPLFESGPRSLGKDTVLSGPNLAAPLGIGLCYDLLFPAVFRQFAKDGAGLFGNIAFNTWLGNTNWPHLHAAYLPFRAVEQGRWAFFLNNSGSSLIVDAQGRLQKALPQGRHAVLRTEMPFLMGETWYQKWGDAPVMGFCVLVILFGQLWGPYNPICRRS